MPRTLQTQGGTVLDKHAACWCWSKRLVLGSTSELFEYITKCHHVWTRKGSRQGQGQDRIKVFKGWTAIPSWTPGTLSQEGQVSRDAATASPWIQSSGYACSCELCSPYRRCLYTFVTPLLCSRRLYIDPVQVVTQHEWLSTIGAHRSVSLGL